MKTLTCRNCGGALTIYRVAKNGIYKSPEGVLCYANGSLVTGWFEIDEGKLYFNPETGVMIEGDAMINGTLYGFESFVKDGLTLYRTTGPKHGFRREIPDGMARDRRQQNVFCG